MNKEATWCHLLLQQQLQCLHMPSIRALNGCIPHSVVRCSCSKEKLPQLRLALTQPLLYSVKLSRPGYVGGSCKIPYGTRHRVGDVPGQASVANFQSLVAAEHDDKSRPIDCQTKLGLLLPTALCFSC